MKMSAEIATIQEWAMARFLDVHRREFDQSLISVGPDKPLGGQGFPVTDLRSAVGSMLKLVGGIIVVRSRGRHKGCDGMVRSGGNLVWLYRWHRDGLIRVLDEHSETLQSEGWPTSGSLKTIVTKMADQMVAPMTPLYVMIADAYGDTLNPGRPGVLPGVSRAEMLAAFKTAAGFDDPSSVYFRRFPEALLSTPKGSP